MDCLLVFNPSRHHILHFIIFFIFFSLMLSLPFFFFQIYIYIFSWIWLKERLWLLQPPIVPLNTYLSKNFRDHRLHQNDMSFEAYMEFMGHIKEIDIQWAVEWWHIARMVHSCCKDYCVPLVGLRCYLYYSTCRISRQFREC